MIHSMTAFARTECKHTWGSAVWEIRSVNQRFLETYIRLPEQFRSLEPTIRDKLRKKLQRGKLECQLRITANDANTGELQLNLPLANQLIEAASYVQEKANHCQLSATDILKWPGVLNSEDADIDQISKDIMANLDIAINQFLDARLAEGNNLKAMIEQRLQGISEEAQKVRGHMPTVMEWQKQKITQRFEEAKIELESTRVEQELVLLAQKLDVAEELDRLESHVSETQKILKKGGAVGRRLDFMMQEFNREANTLGSKSINTDITQSAVELKVLIEQMREQIQNIE